MTQPDLQPRRPRQLTSPTGRFLLWCLVLAAALALLGGRLWTDDLDDSGRVPGLISWAAFMAGTFEFHIALACGAASVLAFLVKQRRIALAAALVASVGLLPAAWSYRPRTPETIHGAPICVMSVNLLYSRADMGVLREQVERVRPDIILFQEYTVAGAPALRETFKADFPYAAEYPEDDAFGQAVYSRRPFSAPARAFPPTDDQRVAWPRPQILATVEHEGKQLGFLDVHLWTPISLGNVIEQRRQAAAIRRYADRLLETGAIDGLVIAGDFNATPNSPHLRTFTAGGFTSALDAAGRGRGGTWPRKGSLRLAPPIRLDHILTSGGLEVVWSGVECDNGSDHRPVAARVGWK